MLGAAACKILKRVDQLILAALDEYLRFGGLSVRQLAGRVWVEMGADELTDRAAALSYYFLFALFPTLLFLTTVLGMLPIADVMDRLLKYSRDVLPPDAASLLHRTLDEIQEGARGGLLSISAVAASHASSSMYRRASF